MSLYTIRVELLNCASRASYDTLHALMEASRYYRKIQSENGTWFDLPPAEYAGFSYGTLAAVRDYVAQLAREVDPSVRVRVTEGLSAWAGLDRSAYQGGPEWYVPINVLDYLSKPALQPPSYSPSNDSPFAALLAPPRY